jgi:peptidoglycan/LPS O-acetylase OafA/YrhL
VLLASYGTLLIDTHFEPHLEMVAFFWWGAFYGYCRRARCDALPLLMAVLALLAFVQLGPHGPERTAMLVCAAGLVHLAMGVSSGARLTGPFGDLSYGVYIMAFPVQQLGVHLMHGLDWSLPAHLALSVAGTLGLAYASWHLIEKRALRFKPGGANR